jgi:hypothetical protein
VIDASRIPSTKPPFDGFFTDDRGYLWVVSFVVDPASDLPIPLLRSFDVFDERGYYLGKVQSPTDLYPMMMPRIVGSQMYGVAVDEYGVPSVVRLHIEGRD